MIDDPTTPDWFTDPHPLRSGKTDDIYYEKLTWVEDETEMFLYHVSEEDVTGISYEEKSTDEDYIDSQLDAALSDWKAFSATLPAEAKGPKIKKSKK